MCGRDFAPDTFRTVSLGGSVNKIPAIPKRVYKDTRKAARVRRRYDRKKYGQGRASARRG